MIDWSMVADYVTFVSAGVGLMSALTIIIWCAVG